MCYLCCQLQHPCALHLVVSLLSMAMPLLCFICYKSPHGILSEAVLIGTTQVEGVGMSQRMQDMWEGGYSQRLSPGTCLPRPQQRQSWQPFALSRMLQACCSLSKTTQARSPALAIWNASVRFLQPFFKSCPVFTSGQHNFTIPPCSTEGVLSKKFVHLQEEV